MACKPKDGLPGHRTYVRHWFTAYGGAPRSSTCVRCGETNPRKDDESPVAIEGGCRHEGHESCREGSLGDCPTVKHHIRCKPVAIEAWRDD